MKKLTTSLLASLAMAASALAGHQVVDNSKDKSKTIPEPTCFNDREFQIDLFGLYQDGNGFTHAGNIRDHGWGGGVGANFFFTRYIGVGAEYQIVDARRNEDQPRLNGHNPNTAQNSVNGMLIFRLPIDRACLAPYAYVGGGAVLAGENWATVFGGAGVEYRVVPNRVGLFVDGRFTYFGDRFGDGDLNHLSARAGVKLVF